jgi:NAD(P)-dependent dehydrogenase (short-subunit alcohol dehydrogenase family)
MRVVAVTGGASGIGAAVARAFAAGGDAVAISDLDERSGLALVDELRASGASAAFVAADVTTPEGAAAVVALADASFGQLHAACNCAGIAGVSTAVADLDPSAWDHVLSVNLTGIFLAMRAQLPAIERSGGGAIVNVSSTAGLMGVAGMAAYSASKHGVIGLTRSAALEWAASGIRINALCPGTTRTPMLRGFVGGDEQALEAAGRHGSPMRRLAEPEEVAAAALWLCSDAASYVTGHAMAVDGGAAAT